MKNFIYPEMMVHVPLCTHKDPKNILILSDNAVAIGAEVSKHYDIKATTVTPLLKSIQVADAHSFDVIISECTYDDVMLAHVSRALKDDGLFVTTHPQLDNIDANKKIMSELGKYFKIIMPYHLEDGSTLLLASKEYHPTADIILQRADMLDDLEYYNSDVHIAAFAMGNYIKRAYLGIIKN